MRDGGREGGRDMKDGGRNKRLTLYVLDTFSGLGQFGSSSSLNSFLFSNLHPHHTAKSSIPSLPPSPPPPSLPHHPKPGIVSTL